MNTIRILRTDTLIEDSLPIINLKINLQSHKMKNSLAIYKHNTNIPRNKNLTDYSFSLRKSKLETRKNINPLISQNNLKLF